MVARALRACLGLRGTHHSIYVLEMIFYPFHSHSCSYLIQCATNSTICEDEKTKPKCVDDKSDHSFHSQNGPPYAAPQRLSHRLYIYILYIYIYNIKDDGMRITD